jgi:hypothetical protein
MESRRKERKDAQSSARIRGCFRDLRFLGILPPLLAVLLVPCFVVAAPDSVFAVLRKEVVRIPLRDGTFLAGTLFLPEGNGPWPVVASCGPDIRRSRPHGSGLLVPGVSLSGDVLPGCLACGADPESWTSFGYAVLLADSRGTGDSPGRWAFPGTRSGEDVADLVAWAAGQPWCDGAVGLWGVGLAAQEQWWGAALAPPSLRAVIALEGGIDLYRDLLFPGGIPAKGLWRALSHLFRDESGLSSPEVLLFRELDVSENPLHAFLYSPAYESSSLSPSAVTLPFLVGGRAVPGIPALRGSLEMYRNAPSPEKHLLLAASATLDPFFVGAFLEEQRRFFDAHLKRLPLREHRADSVLLGCGNSSPEVRRETLWPGERTLWTRFYLNAAAGTLETYATSPAEMSFSGGPETRVLFESAPFEEDSLFSGPVTAFLSLSSGRTELDVFVTVEVVGGTSCSSATIGENQPGGRLLSGGWLRGSLRRLDPRRSERYFPFHGFSQMEPLTPGHPVEMTIALSPLEALVRKGERLRVVLSARPDASLAFLDLEKSPETGDGTIHTGGTPARSYLVLPLVVPPEKFVPPLRET